ncbi:MAG: hypothetical protein ACRDF7_09260 [Candidatus Limnocylindrales bacterium]
MRIPVDLSQPHDQCARCGRPTPLGVSLCDDDNPAGLRPPSATQVHGTILGGVVVGFVLLAVLAHVVLSGLGPFPTNIQSATAKSDGGVDVVFSVDNGGSKASAATCRITRGGVGIESDPVFRTASIEPGATISVARTLPPPPPGDPAWNPARLVVRCS